MWTLVLADADPSTQRSNACTMRSPSRAGVAITSLGLAMSYSTSAKEASLVITWKYPLPPWISKVAVKRGKPGIFEICHRRQDHIAKDVTTQDGPIPALPLLDGWLNSVKASGTILGAPTSCKMASSLIGGVTSGSESRAITRRWLSR